MIRIIFSIIWFLVFAKIFLFWIWLWQLKEYHFKRFLAHFETQAWRKFFFCLKGLRFPKPTLKILLLSGIGFILPVIFLFQIFPLNNFWFYFLAIVSLLLLPVYSSLLVLIFQIPATMFQKLTLSKAEKRLESFKDLIVIGITGSFGKTSTKEFLAKILSRKFKVLKTEKHINAEIGIAKTILEKLKPEHQILIAEIGAYEKGKIKEVCQMLKPKIGILTGINEQHFSTFGSQENIINAKFELVESLPENGMAILNGDNQAVMSNVKCQMSNAKVKNFKFCSTKEKLDIFAENIRIEKEFASFRAFSKDGDFADFKVNLPGRQNIVNILLAAACAKELGMNLKEISEACLEIKPEQGGMKFLRKENPVVLDASYSANSDGVMADLEYLKLYEGRKIIVMPCLIELNGAAKEVHKRIGQKINEVCDFAIVATADYFKEIKQNSPKIILVESPEKIIEKLKEFKGKGDAILLEGRLPRAIIDFFEKK